MPFTTYDIPLATQATLDAFSTFAADLDAEDLGLSIREDTPVYDHLDLITVDSFEYDPDA